MGTAASMNMPDEIHFHDLLRLAPALTEGSKDRFKVDRLERMFREKKGDAAFLTRDEFIELVLQYGAIVHHRDGEHEGVGAGGGYGAGYGGGYAGYDEGDVGNAGGGNTGGENGAGCAGGGNGAGVAYLGYGEGGGHAAARARAREAALPAVKPTLRFKGQPLYDQVRLMEFNNFCSFHKYPCLSAPGVLPLTITADCLDFENSYVVFISHRWMRPKIELAAGSVERNSRYRRQSLDDSGELAQLVADAKVTGGASSPKSPAGFGGGRVGDSGGSSPHAAGNSQDSKLGSPKANSDPNNTSGPLGIDHPWGPLGIGHPDDEVDSQFALCVAGLKKLRAAHLMGFKHVYVWLDYTCLDLRPDTTPASQSTSHGYTYNAIPHSPHSLTPFGLNNPNPYSQTQNLPWPPPPLPLATIMSICDCLFTPLVDHDISWEMPIVKNFWEQYDPLPWSSGPSAYLNRAWCRTELFYATNVPLPDDVWEADTWGGGGQGAEHTTHTPATSPTAATSTSTSTTTHIYAYPHTQHPLSRRAKMSIKLRNRAWAEQRPVIIYSSYEARMGLPPLIKPPLPNKYIDRYAPLAGQASIHSDRTNAHVLKRLLKELQPHIARVRYGYEGEMDEEGRMHGKGRYVYKSGETYDGDWVRGRRQGLGMFVHSSGDVYEGEFQQDKEVGMCSFRYANGDTYFGSLRHGRKYGEGVLEFRNGDLYEGMFRNDKRQGQGILRYAAGGSYLGHFKHDERQGQGVLMTGGGGVGGKGVGSKVSGVGVGDGGKVGGGRVRCVAIWAPPGTVKYGGWWRHDEQDPTHEAHIHTHGHHEHGEGHREGEGGGERGGEVDKSRGGGGFGDDSGSEDDDARATQPFDADRHLTKMASVKIFHRQKSVKHGDLQID